MVEPSDLLPEDEVLEQRGAAVAGLEAELVADGPAKVVGEELVLAVDGELVVEAPAGGRGLVPAAEGRGVGIGADGEGEAREAQARPCNEGW